MASKWEFEETVWRSLCKGSVKEKWEFNEIILNL